MRTQAIRFDNGPKLYAMKTDAEVIGRGDAQNLAADTVFVVADDVAHRCQFRATL